MDRGSFAPSLQGAQSGEKRRVSGALEGLADECRLIILACVPNQTDDVRADMIALLQRPLNWQFVIHASIEHSVAPLLYARLRQSQELDSAIAIPPAVLADLQDLYSCSKSRNTKMYGAIAELFGSFQASKVNAMALKDLSLTREVFTEPALRPMGDVDILIRPEQYEAMRECLQKLDFVPLPGPDNQLIMKYAWGHHFWRKRDDMWVDLQWNILQRDWSSRREDQQIDVDELWADASRIPIDGVDVLRPSMEHMLYHLCLHLEGHQYSELILFVEVAELLARCGDQLNWDSFLAMVRRFNTGRSVHQALSFAARLLRAPVPREVLEQMLPSSSITPAALQPLFAPLSRLHMQLDEIRLVADPPPEVLEQMEATARRHATAGTQVSRELQQIAQAMLAGDGSVFWIECEPSERRFADTSLKAFGGITAFVLDSELPRARQVLAEQGYRQGDQVAGSWQKTVELRCPDEVPSPDFVLEYEVSLSRMPGAIFKQHAAATISSRSAALTLLRRRLLARDEAVERIPVHIRLVTVSAEELAAYLLAQVGAQSRDRMFGIASMIEGFGERAGTLNWEAVADCARAHNLNTEFQRGLALFRAFADQKPPLSVSPDKMGEHILASARYDHFTTELSISLKRGFFCIWTLLLIRGFGQRVKYAVRILRRKMALSTIPVFIANIGRALHSRVEHQNRTEILAYWVEPALLERLTSRGSQDGR